MSDDLYKASCGVCPFEITGEDFTKTAHTLQDHYKLCHPATVNQIAANALARVVLGQIGSALSGRLEKCDE